MRAKFKARGIVTGVKYSRAVVPEGAGLYPFLLAQAREEWRRLHPNASLDEQRTLVVGLHADVLEAARFNDLASAERYTPRLCAAGLPGLAHFRGVVCSIELRNQRAGIIERTRAMKRKLLRDFAIDFSIGGNVGVGGENEKATIAKSTFDGTRADDEGSRRADSRDIVFSFS